MSDIAGSNNSKTATAKPYSGTATRARSGLKVAAKQAPKLPTIAEQDLLRLSQLWQSTLDIHLLLDKLIAELPKFVPYDSITYFHLEQALERRVGQGGKHSCSYKLTLQGSNLGQLELTRSKRFSEDELFILERILGTFIHSLRNAVDHHKILQSAYTDMLTGLLNRNALDHLLPKEIKRAQRNDTPLAVVFLDLDHFKTINDRFGHRGGDQLLRQSAILLESSVRGSDAIYRYGGEEFVILLPNTDLEGARLVGEKIIANFNAMDFSLDGSPLKVTASAGITLLQRDDTQSLIDRADQAMYLAKQGGRNRICVK